MPRRNHKSGFTLIELLFVVLIIGILASVVLANYAPTKQRARDSRRISDIAQIQSGLEAYFQDSISGSTYPLFFQPNFTTVKADAAGKPLLPCQAYSTGNSAPGGTACLTIVSGTGAFLPSLPTDPASSGSNVVNYDYYSCDPAGPNASACKNADSGSYYQAYCVGANLENAAAQSTAMNAANASCSGVTWCDILQNPSHYNSGKGDNYVVCRK